jgi:predicted permease
LWKSRISIRNPQLNMPDWIQEIGRRLASLKLAPEREAEIVDELSQDLDDCYAELLAGGATEDEAYRETLAELSGRETLRRELRRVERRASEESIFRAEGRRTMFANFWHDLRFGARALRKTPGFTATALATLALCIGANLTIFAVVDAVLLRPLPFPEADRLTLVYNTYPKAGVMNDGSSLTNYYERRGRIEAFSGLALYREGGAVIGEAGSTERESVMQVTPEFFSTLEVGPVLGRAFNEEEMNYRADGVAILTDAYWRRQFTADPNVIGREMRADGVRKKVIGVLPPDFRFLSSQARLYFPLSSSLEERAPDRRHSGGGDTIMIGRLKPGATLAAAQSEIDAHNSLADRDNPEARMIAEAGFRSMVVPLRAHHVAAIRPTLLLVQAGVLCLLLIGGVNLVNLLLIRASGRARELAIRQSLGAERRHVISQVMTETVLLTLVGGLFGLIVVAGGIRILGALGADQLPLGAQIAFDGRLALSALIASVALGVVIGLPIAAFAIRSRLADALQSETRGGAASRAAQRLRHSFIVAQIALALVLLTSAGMLGLSLKRVMAVSPGFRPERVLSGRLSLPQRSYPNTAARVAFAERLTEEIRSQPGVSAAGVGARLPFGGYDGKSAFTPEGYVPRPGESPRGHYLYGVGGDYFSALGVPLREGRLLEGADLRRADRVCVVDEDFARRYWPQGGAVGRRLFQGLRPEPGAEAFTVVGVVGAVKQTGLTDEQGQGAVYLPYSNYFDDTLFVVVRLGAAAESFTAGGTPELFGKTLQNIVRKIDPELPLNDLRSMDARIADSLVARRSSALLIGLFAAVALLLTAVGAYGVLSYAVAQRNREIGIRMALGAEPRQIGGQFLALGLRLLTSGAALGVAGAWMAGKAMQGILYNMPALSLAPLAAALGVLSAVSLAACMLPARRAAKVDPLAALRGE